MEWECDAFTKMIHEMGFKMVGIGVDYDALTKDLTPVIEQAKKMGASYVICFWIGHNGDEFGMADVRGSSKTIQQSRGNFQSSWTRILLPYTWV